MTVTGVVFVVLSAREVEISAELLASLPERLTMLATDGDGKSFRKEF